MSYDVFLQAFRGGNAGPADAPAARAVVERFAFRHEPEFGALDITLSDGAEIEMYAKGLLDGGQPFTGAMIALRGMTDSMASFIYEFSRAAGCVIFNPAEQPSVLVPREDLAGHLPADVARDMVKIPVRNGAEVLAALRGGFKEWAAYRDQIVKAGQGGGPASGT
jgi:hypothetical protein